ncbi:MAG: ATP synthase subunit I [Cyanobacteriota bacterium]
MDDFQRLQRRLQWITLSLAAGAVLITVLVFDRSTAFSLSIGAVGALLYLRLLARSVSRLGENSRSVGKVQLLVPIVLVLAASRLPELSILPVFLGFLLYKPAVIIQALTDP